MINWKDYSVAMQGAVTSTLENITFTLVEEYHDEQDVKELPFSNSELKVSLSDVSFSVKLSLPTDFLEDLVSTLYPTSVGNKEGLISDTLNELNNTVCGSFFRNLENTFGSFTLGLPDMLENEKYEELYTYSFLLDDMYKLIVSIRE